MRTELPAFTLMEMIVVLLLAGIGLSLAAFVLLTSYNRFNNFHYNSMAVQQLYQLQYVLQLDSDRSNQVRQVGNQLRFESGERIVGYIMEGDRLIRTSTSGSLDTFARVSVEPVKLGNSSLISAIVVTSTDPECKLFVEKQYACEELLQFNDQMIE